MKGTKRFASQSGPAPDSNDNVFKSKRIIAGSPFDPNRAEPSKEGERVHLDVQRAESSRQHVRALNKQFLSWVQSQLQDHPDELWEDGVQDYLTHASHIKEKFSDVVAWIKANPAKPGSAHEAEKIVTEAKSNEGNFELNNNNVFGLAGSTFMPGSDKKVGSEAKNHEIKFQPNNSGFGLAGSTFSQGTEKKVEPEKKNPEAKFQPNNNSVFGLASSTFSQGTEKKAEPEKKNPEAKFQLNNNSVFGQVGSSPSFASPWNSGLLKNSQSPVLFGSPSSVPVNRDASDDADAEDEVEKPSSPSVKKTEEKGIIVVHEVKCKLYIKSTDPADKDTWKDKGMGQLSIKCKEGISKATKESKPTVIVRNDVGKVLLNALLYPGIKTNLLKNAIAAIFHTSSNADGGGEVVARTYLLRTKTEDERNKLASAIQEYAPTA